MNRALAVDVARRAAAALKTHSERESLALELAGAAAGEEFQFLKCDRGTLTGWIETPERSVVQFTPAEKEAIKRMGHNPDLVARMSEVRSPADYQRIKREVEGGAS